MTPPYFSSTSHKKFFFSSPVHRSAHENIKIRQYMFTQKYLINYLTSAKSSISDPFFIVGQYHLLINCYLGLFSSIRFWTFCFTYSISFSGYQWLTVHDLHFRFIFTFYAFGIWTFFTTYSYPFPVNTGLLYTFYISASFLQIFFTTYGYSTNKIDKIYSNNQIDKS